MPPTVRIFSLFPLAFRHPNTTVYRSRARLGNAHGLSLHPRSPLNPTDTTSKIQTVCRRENVSRLARLLSKDR